jgi:hypothetical protein
VIRAEPIHIETQKTRGRSNAKKRGTSSGTSDSDNGFRKSEVKEFAMIALLFFTWTVAECKGKPET